MLIRAICSVAIYCPRCGQIHIQDLLYFSGKAEAELHCNNCGCVVASYAFERRRGLVLYLPCIICGTESQLSYSTAHEIREALLQEGSF